MAVFFCEDKETFRQYCARHVFYFNIVTGVPDVPFDMRRVHPLKQRLVYKLYELFKSSNVVTEAWIFGSSVSYTCHQGSDTDIIIHTTEPARVYTEAYCSIHDKIEEMCNNNCDILRYENLSYNDFVRLTNWERGVKIL